MAKPDDLKAKMGLSGPPLGHIPSAPPALPDHELIRRIGGGSYGEVWLARNIMGTYRAVKIVHRKSFANERPFEREFRGIQKFEPISRSHESQVDILHIGRSEDCFYYVMELADDANPPLVAADVRRLTSCGTTGGEELDQSLLTSAATYSPKTLTSEIQQRGRLPFDECLEIGLALTTALAHLHKHGLVHRDVKPSNVIFVNGIPKLADIGLVTDFAGTVSFVGTEGFLPPEGPGTPQADLYSLGKVLYEISTGKDRQDFPEPPTLLEEFPDREQMLELGEIIKRACARDVRQRYATAELMNADLLLLKTGKSVRRTRLLERRLAVVTRVGVAAGLVALLAVGAYAVAHNQARRAKEVSQREAKLRLEAEADKKKAQLEAAKSKQVAQFLKEMLRGVGPASALGRNTEMLREILDKTAGRLNELTNQPAVEADLRATLGNVYRDLGQYTNAEAMHLAALALRRKLHGDEHADVASSLHELAAVFRLQARLDEAETHFREALAMRRKLFGNTNTDVADSLFALADNLSRKGTHAEAEEAHREALAIRRALPGLELDVAKSLMGLGSALREAGKISESEAPLREAVAMHRKFLSEKHPELAISLYKLAQTLRLMPTTLAEAETNLLEALAIQKEVLGDHRDTATSLNYLGAVFLRQGRPAEAEKMQREALKMQRKVLGDHANEGLSLQWLGAALRRQGRLAEAEDAYREAFAVLRKFLGDIHGETTGTLIGLVGVLRAQGKLNQAETLCRETLLIKIKLLGEQDARVGGAYFDLADVLSEEGKFAEAEGIYRKAAESGDPEALNNAAWFLATCREAKLRNGTNAVTFAEKAVAKTARKNPGYLDTLAAAYAEAGQFSQAVSVQQEAIALAQEGRLKNELAGRLKLYEANSPYRELASQTNTPSAGASKTTSQPQ